MYTAPSRSDFFCCNSQRCLSGKEVIECDIVAVHGETESDGVAHALARTSHESDTLRYSSQASESIESQLDDVAAMKPSADIFGKRG
jgi:hypothetical protein